MKVRVWVKVKFSVSIKKELMYDLVHTQGHHKDQGKGRFRMKVVTSSE